MTAPRLSIVIPTLNAAATLPDTLAALAEAGAAAEIIVADGGSTDATPALAPRLVTAPRGRGPQLQAGAAAAKGDWLLILHADSVPAPGWWAAAQRHMAEHPDSAAAFTLRFASPDRRARRIERLVAWRCRLLALPYGDQGLLLPRALYDRLGGYRPLPLMEDVDLVRRIARRRLRLLDTVVTTSAVRYERDGWLRRPLRNLACLGLWMLGVPAARLVRFYGGRRP
ncbi:TIGR04283 family arsenosugar biosynthesis glycosyltransferase [Caenispirillum bisanense]|uniref:TIGR04283 family arsenosugar biosynthesis glycosyltransferase n=1 Tax=Caenispirillum bisanense TaxID=414052 RepID=UPI0031DCDE99